MAKYTKYIEIIASSDDEATKVSQAMSDIYDITRQKSSTKHFFALVDKLREKPTKILAALTYFKILW